MLPVNLEFSSRVAFTFLNEEAPMTNPAPYTQAALFTVANNVHYMMFPSSQGSMMLMFDSMVKQDAVVHMSSIVHDGGHASLECSEETSNRFLVLPEWLVAISATGSPLGH
jgi:hypothetical protein